MMLTISALVLPLFFQAVISQSTESAVTVTTAVPSPTAPSASLLPSQVPPTKQSWCPSEIFCPGAVRCFQRYGCTSTSLCRFNRSCKLWLLQMFIPMIKLLWTRYKIFSKKAFVQSAISMLINSFVANKQEISGSTCRFPKYLRLNNLW